MIDTYAFVEKYMYGWFTSKVLIRKDIYLKQIRMILHSVNRLLITFANFSDPWNIFSKKLILKKKITRRQKRMEIYPAGKG